jgi:tetratricopeptide (TPR) repeat protein
MSDSVKAEPRIGWAPAPVENPNEALMRAQTAAQTGRFGEAEGICQDVLKLAQHPAAYAIMGAVAAEQKQWERAVMLTQQGIERFPNEAAWHSNLGMALGALCRTEEAMAASAEAVRLAPDNPDCLCNRALLLRDVDDYEGARDTLLHALQANPQHCEAHLALAEVLLSTGEWEPGWREYEWRTRTRSGADAMPAFQSSPWTGVKMPNGKLVVVADQGYGDAIQFARYLPMVAERVQEVVLGCSPELLPVLSQMSGVSMATSQWDQIPEHSAHVRITSMGYVFNTRRETIPQTVPYLAADPEKVMQWGERLERILSPIKPRIGLVWSGRPTHPNNLKRSLKLGQLFPLTMAGKAAFVSLQKPFPETDAKWVKSFPGLTDLSADLTDFSETAAAIANLDLVITVDTGIAHLAGAMGKKVWVLIYKAPDWRWGLKGSQTPWYPSMRLFRQDTPGDMAPVIEEVAEQLAKFIRR